MQSSKIIEEGDGSSVVVHWDTAEGEGCVVANRGYNFGVGSLCNAEDTGNGYIFHFPSYTPVYQDNYICLNYAEADYIFQVMKFLGKINKGKTEGKEVKDEKEPSTKKSSRTKPKGKRSSCKETATTVIEDAEQDCNCVVCKKIKQSEY